MKVIFTIGLAVCGLILFALLNVVIRRWDAHIRSREDYDEDVDGKMMKKDHLELASIHDSIRLIEAEYGEYIR